MIAEIKLRAERRAGELLAEMGDAKTGPKTELGNTMLLNSVSTLSDLGITRMQSSRWQSIAQIPEQVFEKHLIETRESKEELTSAGHFTPPSIF